MKKNKLNNKGFILAETLVVTVFLMILFSMLYSNFYPLIGEYEKRENYDTVDGKYSAFWLKRMIEDKSYALLADNNSILNFDSRGYVRFRCSDVSEEDDKRATCINLVKSMQIEGCDKKGDNCEIYITKYRIGDESEETSNFKKTVKNNLKKYEENCFSNKCHQKYISNCINEKGLTDSECSEEAEKKVFRSSFQDYVNSLPDYTIDSLNGAEYRVIAEFHNRKDNNNYFSYATIEVNRGFVPTTTSSNMHTVSIKYNANGGKFKDEHGEDYSMSGNIILKEGTSTIHVLLGGRKLPDDGLLNYNDATNINLERLGYYIEEGKEWNTKSDGTGIDFNQDNPYEAENFCPDLSSGNCIITLYANWKPETYSITYDANGGTIPDNPTSYTIETETFTLNSPTSDEFTGWTGSNGTELQKTVKINKGSVGNMTFTANWMSKGPFINNENPPEVFQTLAAALNGTTAGYIISLNYDFTDSSTPTSSKNVTLDLKGHILTTKNLLAITAGTMNLKNGIFQNATTDRTIEVRAGTLNIGTSGDNTTITEVINKKNQTKENQDSCTIYIKSGAATNIEGDKVTIKAGMGGSSRYAKTIHNAGKLVFKSGKIIADAQIGNGATAINTTGTFTMTGGYIYSSKLANQRCGVCVNGGTTRVTGGTIEVKDRTSSNGLDGGALDRVVSNSCTYVGKNVTLKCTNTKRCLYGNHNYLYKESGGPNIIASNVENKDTGTKVGSC